jgi:hypothetical protein
VKELSEEFEEEGVELCAVCVDDVEYFQEGVFDVSDLFHRWLGKSFIIVLI